MHTMKNYSTIEKKKSCICNNVDELEGHDASEMSQKIKDKYMVSHVEFFLKVIFIEAESKMVIAKDWDIGKVGRCF